MIDRQFDVRLAADRAWSVFEPAFTSMAAVAEAVKSLAQNAEHGPEILHSGDFEAIKPRLLKELAGLPSPVIGICVIFEVGVLEDVEYWMPALEREGANIRDGSHDLDPSSDRFYDYTLLDWLTPSARTLPSAHGPYIDLGGTDQFTITTSAPAQIGDKFLGTIAVDFSHEVYEQSIVPLLHEAPGGFTILNAEHRVVASNDADRAVGALLLDIDENELVPCGPYGWGVLYQP